MTHTRKHTALIATAIMLAVGFTPAHARAFEYEQAISLENTSVEIDTIEDKDLKENALYIPTKEEQNAFTLSSFFRFPLTQENFRGISTRFSARHLGMDILGKLNAEIKPIAAGKVIEIDFERGGYGNFVVIEHENGLHSLYAHMTKPEVKEGEFITAETVIGKVGMTGRTTGPHIHFEIHVNGKHMNPEVVLPITGGQMKLSASKTSTATPRLL